MLTASDLMQAAYFALVKGGRVCPVCLLAGKG